MSVIKNRNRTMEGLKIERDDLRSTIERVKAVLAKSIRGARPSPLESARPTETSFRKGRGRAEG